MKYTNLDEDYGHMEAYAVKLLQQVYTTDVPFCALISSLRPGVHAAAIKSDVAECKQTGAELGPVLEEAMEQYQESRHLQLTKSEWVRHCEEAIAEELALPPNPKVLERQVELPEIDCTPRAAAEWDTTENPLDEERIFNPKFTS